MRWIGVGALLVALAGCLDARSSRCANGEVCAAGKLCVALPDRTTGGATSCVDSDQLQACVGHADGDPCATSNIPGGSCIDGICVSATGLCGNTIIDPGEQCDCGTADDPNPACTGPNSDSSGVCSTTCELRCGDGIVEPDEECDPRAPGPVACAGASFDRGLTTCSASCTAMASDGCRYIGWRTRVKQLTVTTDVAPVGSIDHGFALSGSTISIVTDYISTGVFFTAEAPLIAVWAVDDNTAFAVGNGGTVVRWDGVGWMESSPVLVDSSPLTVDLRGVWGRGGNDVYAIGDDTVIHWDGVAWASLAPPPGAFRAIAGDATHVYVAGDHGTLLVFDGVSWQAAAVGTVEDLRGVWSAGGIVVAVGTNGTIVQDDGTGWAPGRASTTANLLSVWGDGVPVGDNKGFFAVGERGTVLFFDGRVWRPMSLGHGVTGSPTQTFFKVRGVDHVGVGVGGTDDLITYEGSAWSPTAMPTAQTIDGLWGTATDDVFAVGSNGTILHHDGLAWTLQAAPTTVDLHGVWGTGSNNVYAAGDDLTLLHYNGTSWTTVHTGPLDGVTGNFEAVFTAAPNDVHVVGTTGIYHYDGVELVRFVTELAAQRAVWGSSASDVWAAGNDGVEHFDGAWAVDSSLPDPMVALGGTAPDDVYAVGPTSHHYDGAWSPGPFATEDKLAAVCAAPGRVFAAGSGGRLRHLIGTTIEPLLTRTRTDLNALFLTGRLVFMAGADGTLEILVFDN